MCSKKLFAMNHVIYQKVHVNIRLGYIFERSNGGPYSLPASHILWKWYEKLIHQMIASKSNNQLKRLQHEEVQPEVITELPEFSIHLQLAQSTPRKT